jgi:hypothetical protein
VATLTFTCAVGQQWLARRLRGRVRIAVCVARLARKTPLVRRGAKRVHGRERNRNGFMFV